MSVLIQTASAALKDLYLEPAREQLNIAVNPLYNEIVKTSKRIEGNKVKVYIPYGVNGGVGSSKEDAQLPMSGRNSADVFETTLKDMYATIRISQKAIDLSRNRAASFVNLLEDTMKKTIESAKFIYSRQLFTDGTGNIGTVASAVSNAAAVTLKANPGVKYLTEGMIIEFYRGTSGVAGASGSNAKTIVAVDRLNNVIYLDGNVTLAQDDFIVNQSSYSNELSGMKYIFDSNTIYGVDRTNKHYLKPYSQALNGVISDQAIQQVLDYIDEVGGVSPNYLSCSYGVRRAYVEYMEATRRNVNTLDLKGGFKAISYNGIPLVADKHEDAGTLRALSTEAFALNRPGDWDWMTEDGSILKQVPNYPHYSATLYIFSELTCNHLVGQGRLTAITEA